MIRSRIPLSKKKKKADRKVKGSFICKLKR